MGSSALDASNDFQTTAKSICEVHVRGKGRFPISFGKSLCYEVLPFMVDVMQTLTSFFT